MLRKFLFFLVLALIPSSHADDSLFDVLNETYIDSIVDLPYSDGVPEQNVQTSGHIRGWIDIVGFRDVVRDNGINYTNGNPASKAIVQYGAWGSGVSVDSITESVTTYISNDNTVAQMDVRLDWHYYYSCNCDEDGCSTCRQDVTEYATFQDTETSPQIYQPLSSTFTVNLTQYNTSIYENVGIRVSKPEGIGKTMVKYGTNTSTHITKIGHVEQTEKGVYFANMAFVDCWDVTGFNKINGEFYFNGNLSGINPADIKVTGSNLYESITADTSSYSMARVEFIPEKELTNTLMYGVLGILAIMAWGIYYLVMKVMRAW